MEAMTIATIEMHPATVITQQPNQYIRTLQPDTE